MLATRGFALVLLLAAPLLSGCSQPADDTNTLRRGAGGDPGTLDPALAQDEYAFNVLADLYEGLVAYGPDGALRPGVAESWDVSADGLTWTFWLRDNITFHDGAKLTAEDVKWSLEMVIKPDSIAGFAVRLRRSIAEIEVLEDRKSTRLNSSHSSVSHMPSSA